MKFFFFGGDDYRAKHKIIELKAKFAKEIDETGSGLVEFLGDSWQYSDWHNLTGANSLFARKRMIIVFGLLKRDKTFLESISNSLDNEGDNIVIFYEPNLIYNEKKKKYFILDSEGREKALTIIQEKIRKILEEKAYKQSFASLVGGQLSAWLVDYLSAKQVSIASKAAQVLVGQTGSDLWLLSSEADKLAAHAQAFVANSKAVITLEMVNDLTASSLDQGIFALMDAISSKNKAQAIKLLEEQLNNGAAPAYLSIMFLRQLRILIQVRAMLDSNAETSAITSRLKLHPYVAQKTVNQARNFASNALLKIMDKFIELDKSYKSSENNFIILFDKLILEL